MSTIKFYIEKSVALPAFGLSGWCCVAKEMRPSFVLPYYRGHAP